MGDASSPITPAFMALSRARIQAMHKKRYEKAMMDRDSNPQAQQGNRKAAHEPCGCVEYARSAIHQLLPALDERQKFELDEWKSSKTAWNRSPVPVQGKPSWDTVRTMYTKDSDDAADRAMVDGFVKVLRSSPKPPGCLVLDSQFAVNIFKVCTCHNGKGKCRNNQLLEDALTEAGYKDGTRLYHYSRLIFPVKANGGWLVVFLDARAVCVRIYDPTGVLLLDPEWTAAFQNDILQMVLNEEHQHPPVNRKPDEQRAMFTYGIRDKPRDRRYVALLCCAAMEVFIMANAVCRIETLVDKLTCAVTAGNSKHSLDSALDLLKDHNHDHDDPKVSTGPKIRAKSKNLKARIAAANARSKPPKAETVDLKTFQAVMNGAAPKAKSKKKNKNDKRNPIEKYLLDRVAWSLASGILSSIELYGGLPPPTMDDLRTYREAMMGMGLPGPFTLTEDDWSEGSGSEGEEDMASSSSSGGGPSSSARGPSSSAGASSSSAGPSGGISSKGKGKQKA